MNAEERERRNHVASGKVVALEEVLDLISASRSFGPCSVEGIEEGVRALLKKATAEFT